MGAGMEGFEEYVTMIADHLGHADRVGPFRGYSAALAAANGLRNYQHSKVNKSTHSATSHRASTCAVRAVDLGDDAAQSDLWIDARVSCESARPRRMSTAMPSLAGARVT